MAESTVVDNGGAAEAGTPAPAESNWFDGFAPEIASDPSITKFESAEVLAKSYINAQQLIGRDKIPMPVTEEDWANTYSRLGRPDTAGDYDISGDGADWFKDAAHAAGLSNDQAQGLVDAFTVVAGEYEETTATDAENTSAELVAGLKKEWGSAYDAKVAAAQRGLAEYADESFLAYLEETGRGNDPRLIRVFAKVGETLAGDSSLHGQNDNGMTAVDLDAAISQIQGHPAYNDKYNPEHKSLVKKMEILMGEKYGG